MSLFTSSQWHAVRHAAEDYRLYAMQIERAQKDIELINQDLKPVTGVSRSATRRKDWANRPHTSSTGDGLAPDQQPDNVKFDWDFQDAPLLDRLKDIARAVGRVIISGGGFGTGWLIGDGLLLTTHQVLPNRQVAASSFINLGFERTMAADQDNGETFRLRPDIFFMTPRETCDGKLRFALDFTITGVESISLNGQPLSGFGSVGLEEGPGKAIEGEICQVIQHQAGGYKKIGLRGFRLWAYEDLPGLDRHLYYECGARPVSSGSLVMASSTGKLIAMHKASVPRLDAQGRYLRKDGTPFQDGDSEDLIDWIANQGVRISKIIEAIRTYPPLPGDMEQKRRQLLSQMEAQGQPETLTAQPVAMPMPFPLPAGQSKGNLSLPPGPPLVRYLVKVSSLLLIQEYVKATIQEQFPDSRIRPLSANLEGTRLGTYLTVDIPGITKPWETAAVLEAIDGVEEADPDLPRYTSIGGPGDLNQDITEGAARAWFTESTWGDDATEEAGWQMSPYLKGLDRNCAEGKAQVRKWNHRAINFSERKVISMLGETGLQELLSLRLAQLDTGYTPHSKVIEGFNVHAGYDAIEEDQDARDEPSWGPWKFYAHGTRTGSILVGVSDSQVTPAREGNVGLLRTLTEATGVPMLLTPFRIARSVILIGRISELVDAASKAINSGYQVLTMSMGVLPGNSALSDLARFAYEQGVIWCCAAGNRVRFVVAPARYPGVICVAASNPDNGPWKGSCRGPAVDITAPGEFIYVPIINEENEEDMSFGDGTSYATPQVAAAAMLWLARNKRELEVKYSQPWQRVEAFRYCLQVSARRESKLPRDKFGAGILDIEKLLLTPMPDAIKLHHAYTGPGGLEKDTGKQPLAFREAAHLDCQVVLGQGLLPPGETGLQQGPISAKEEAGSVPAQAFALYLEAQTGIRSAALETQPTGPLDFTPEAAYARLLTIYDLEAQTKPRYDVGECLPANVGAAIKEIS